MSSFSEKMRNEIIKKGEVIYVNFPNGDSVLYDLKEGTKHAPHCKYCWNSLDVGESDTPYNSFGDTWRGVCEKCVKCYTIRKV
jgi:hypothetical protein